MNFCSKCGAKLLDGAKFCQECGDPTNGENLTFDGQRRQVYVGNIHKCPNCGENLKSFEVNCLSCGYELRSTKSIDSIRELCRRLEQIEAERVVEKPRSIYKAAYSEPIISKTDEQKATLIRTFPIPNTKEDLIEFIILAHSNIDSDLYANDIHNSARVVSDAWKSKFEQASEKAEVLLANTPELKHIQGLKQKLTSNIKRAKSSNWKITGIIFLTLILLYVAFFVGLDISNSKADAKETARLETIVLEIENCMDRGDYKLALMNAESIETDEYNEELYRQWVIKREYLIERIIEEAAENGIILNRTQKDSHENNDDFNENSKSDSIVALNIENTEVDSIISINYSENTIEKGSEYSYMSDEWNLYVATAISENIVKIENWGKTLSTSKTVDYQYDIGTYKINESENGFTWIDEEKTAFKFALKDSNNSSVKDSEYVIFTVSKDDDNKFKGSSYSKNGISYSLQNDDWHLYRAIPLTETLIKVEAWCRAISLGSFIYGYDVCVININDTSTDFEWLDDEHTAFTITMQDKANDYYWKEPIFVAFTKQNTD